jgi:hypothetical protein
MDLTTREPQVMVGRLQTLAASRLTSEVSRLGGAKSVARCGKRRASAPAT